MKLEMRMSTDVDVEFDEGFDLELSAENDQRDSKEQDQICK